MNDNADEYKNSDVPTGGEFAVDQLQPITVEQISLRISPREERRRSSEYLRSRYT